MTKEITISIVKIMNWSHTQHDAKIEVSFMHASNKTYIAHKSVTGTYIDNTILLDTSFKILYRENKHKLICKVTLLKQHRIKEVVGEAEIDLELFFNRKIQYIAFNDRDKVMEIHRIDDQAHEQFKQSYEQEYVSRDQQGQYNFLQERYDFLDKIKHRQMDLKKDFSEKVYNLLKDIKYARAAQGLKKEIQDKKVANQKIEQHKYQTPQKTFDDKQDHFKKNQGGMKQNANKNHLGKPPVKSYKLMIDSIQAYGRKDPAKEHNICSKNNQAEKTQQQDQLPMQVKKNIRQLKNVRRN